MPLLDWLNKDKAIKQAQQVPYRILQPISEFSYGDESNKNMLIQGDNLDALKAILPIYAGKIQCVYIDPPFNTEQAFDNYDDNLEHSTWLSLMYPRLEIIRDLLSEKGSIFLHIDDNELAYLLVICDELFNRKNRIFIATFKQSSASGPKAINPGVVSTCSYVICYAKNKSMWKHNKVYTSRERDSRYSKIILNFDEPYDNWTIGNLKDAFSENQKLSPKDLKFKLGAKYESKLTEYVLDNAARVARTARVAEKDVGDTAKAALRSSIKNRDKVFRAERNNQEPQYFLNGEQLIFYKNKTKIIDGSLTTAQPLTNLWDDILSNNLHNEGGVKFKKGKKPEYLIKRVLDLSTDENDIVLDSFLGSGTTAATAHKMNRRYIGIEMGDQSETHCLPRLKKVIDGEQGGISKAVEWNGGGGFNFYRLGEAIFDEYGCINPNIQFPELATHIWYMETHTPLHDKANGPLLGIHNGVAYYLLYNGILGDRKPQGGNVLTGPVLSQLPRHDGPKVIFGETSRLGEARLKDENITFKQIPYDVRTR